MTRVLVVDNHDSFVHTLVGYLRELGADTDLIEADATDAAELERILPEYEAVMLSPGQERPPTPERRSTRCGSLCGCGCRRWACAWDIRRSGRRSARP